MYTNLHLVDICLIFSFLCLKGLSHEMDFNNVDENLQMLALLGAAAGFEFFEAPLIFN